MGDESPLARRPLRGYGATDHIAQVLKKGGPRDYSPILMSALGQTPHSGGQSNLHPHTSHNDESKKNSQTRSLPDSNTATSIDSLSHLLGRATLVYGGGGGGWTLPGTEAQKPYPEPPVHKEHISTEGFGSDYGLKAGLHKPPLNGKEKKSAQLNEILAQAEALGIGFTRHEVSRGQTLAGLSIRYNVSVGDIKKYNGLWSEADMHSRGHLLIPCMAGPDTKGKEAGSEGSGTAERKDNGAGVGGFSPVPDPDQGEASHVVTTSTAATHSPSAARPSPSKDRNATAPHYDGLYQSTEWVVVRDKMEQEGVEPPTIDTVAFELSKEQARVDRFCRLTGVTTRSDAERYLEEANHSVEAAVQHFVRDRMGQDAEFRQSSRGRARYNFVAKTEGTAVSPEEVEVDLFKL